MAIETARNFLEWRNAVHNHNACISLAVNEGVDLLVWNEIRVNVSDFDVGNTILDVVEEVCYWKLDI